MTLTLTLDDLESHIIRFVSSTSIHITIVHMAPLSLIVNRRTDRHLSTNVNRLAPTVAILYYVIKLGF